MSNINRVSRSSANSAGLQEKLEGGHQKCGKDAGGDLLGQTGRSETTLSGRGGIAGSGGTTRAGSRGRGCCAASSSRRRRSSGGGLRKGFGGGIASTTLLVRSTGGLSLSIVGMVVNTLDIGLLTNVERQGLGECCAVRHGSVGADAGVGEAGLITFVLRRRTTADLRASVQLSMAPVECSGRVDARWVEGCRGNRGHDLRNGGRRRHGGSAGSLDGLRLDQGNQGRSREDES